MDSSVPAATAFPGAGQRNLQLFIIYNLYRLLLSLILLVSFLFGVTSTVLGSLDRELFQQTVFFYTGLNVLVLLLSLQPARKLLGNAHFVSAVIIADILVLALISYACGGVSSGMAHLLVVPVAAGSVLQPGRISIFFAAVGTIAIFYSESYLYFILEANNQYYVQAALLGIALFATSLAIQILGGRLRQNERIAEQQASRIQSLQEMNTQIIERMRTGIIVVDSGGNILTANGSARKQVLGGEAFERAQLPILLKRQLETWQENPQNRLAPFRLSRSEPQMQANFAYLNPDKNSNILIFLEDYSLLTSRVQQLKLVSLGRLTASIAHEIRNPLGAISHAGQLLTESPDLSEEDRRFAEIIGNHCTRMNSLIENILQLSRNRGEVPQVLEVKEWLEQFAERFSGTVNHAVEFDIEVSPADLRVRMNPSQLEQLMTNLCDNGLRYSMQLTGRPHLCVRAGLMPRHDTRYIDVIDDGPGIAKQDEEKIFEPFFTTENSGTGLGLYICREICEANQAQLVYRRTEDGKSCFRIIFAHPDRHIV